MQHFLSSHISLILLAPEATSKRISRNYSNPIVACSTLKIWDFLNIGNHYLFGAKNRAQLFASIDTPNVGDHDGDVSETKLTERQDKVLSLIKKSPTITGRQMSETLSVSQRTIERDLSALQKMGILRHEGKDNDGVWIIRN